ncbi:hypothetical protein L2E82_46768 [Cichorium intybus]|uniref:Uncharacterized protein n=1 Tax=Cichorium intybus TaxID=13427 RepID=A0ACB8YUA4_CICIN|nr:hypothetical protein L2E82_46768 [Cichorium intybus]
MLQAAFPTTLSIMNTSTVGANLEISKYTINPCQKSYGSSFSARTNKLCYLSKKPTTISFRKYSKNEISCVVKSSHEEGLTYKEAGVDIDAGSELVRRIAKMAPGIGGFGGLFPLGDSYLVAWTDGVRTKLKLAFETGIHDIIGIDLVAMSVNNIITSGAKPLLFLDYYATSQLDVDLAEKVIKGIFVITMLFWAESWNCEMESVINGKNITVRDVLIGLPSSGVHSNGFSLVRRVLARSGLSLKDKLPGESVTLAEALMAPTVIYVKQVLDIISKGAEGIEDGTFNMGIGMVLVVSKEAAKRILNELVKL